MAGQGLGRSEELEKLVLSMECELSRLLIQAELLTLQSLLCHAEILSRLVVGGLTGLRLVGHALELRSAVHEQKKGRSLWRSVLRAIVPFLSSFLGRGLARWTRSIFKRIDKQLCSARV